MAIRYTMYIHSIWPLKRKYRFVRNEHNTLIVSKRRCIIYFYGVKWLIVEAPFQQIWRWSRSWRHCKGYTPLSTKSGRKDKSTTCSATQAAVSLLGSEWTRQHSPITVGGNVGLHESLCDKVSIVSSDTKGRLTWNTTLHVTT